MERMTKMANVSFDLAKGAITIDTEVISKISGIIATGCYGVVGMAHRSKSEAPTPRASM